MYADISTVKVPDSFLKSNMSHDWAFCRWLTITKGVTAIPSSAFFRADHTKKDNQWARFAYCKTDEAIEEAIKRLSKIHES